MVANPGPAQRLSDVAEIGHETRLTLADCLDTCVAAPLRTSLLKALERGGPITLEAGGVVRIGQACLQVLDAGQRAATARGVGFRIDNPSASLVYLAALAGLNDLLAA